MVDDEEEGCLPTTSGRAGSEPCGPTSLRRAEGERKLLRAILMDGMRCLLGEAGGPPAKRAQLAREARVWITSRDINEPFSFENVCGWLELPAGRLRRFLLEQAASRAGSAPVDGEEASDHPQALDARMREARNSSIRALRAAGWKPRDLADRFGMAYSSILFICADAPGEEIGESDGGSMVAEG